MVHKAGRSILNHLNNNQIEKEIFKLEMVFCIYVIQF